MTAAIAAMAACLASGWFYVVDPRRPAAASLDDGWWQFSDQARYLLSALAWAAGSLDPSAHWYLPAYPLLAAPFTGLTPANPFLIPDLACLFATIWLAAALAGRLAPDWRWARPAGAAVAAASVLPPDALDAWVTPWATIPASPLILAGLLAALRLLSVPGNWVAGFVLGCCCGGVGGFRPADALPLAAAACATVAVAMVLKRPGWAAAAKTGMAAILGGLLAVAPTLAAYVAVNGWHSNGYLRLSAAIGFDWRLLPIRWVTIMLSPLPLFADGRGLMEVFPWVATGLAGIAACAVAPSRHGERLPHLLAGGAVCAHLALYLCYRDLHPQGLWRFYNDHYFQWPLVVLAIYSLLLVRTLVRGQWGGAAAGASALALLLPWRAELVLQSSPEVTVQAGSVLRLSPLSLDVGDAVVVPATGTFDAIYSGEHNLYVGADEEKWYSSTADFKVTPRPGGLMVAPLRPLRPGPITVRFGPGVALQQGDSTLAKMHLVYGLPCWLPMLVPACSGDYSGPIVLPGQPIPLDTANTALLGTGWSEAEPGGRWTDGPRATLQLHVSPSDAKAVVFVAHAFAPPGAAPLAVTLSVNGMVVAHWIFTDGTDQLLRADLPPSLVSPDGAMRIALAIANTRRPGDFLRGSSDLRALGLAVRSIDIVP